MKVKINKKEFVSNIKNIFDLNKKANCGVFTSLNGSLSFLVITEDILSTTSLNSIIPNEIGNEIGSCILSSNIYNIIKDLKEESFILEGNETTITIYNTDNLQVYTTTTISVQTWKENIAPFLKHIKNNITQTITLPATIFSNMFDSVSFATTGVDFRECLAGILIEISPNNLRFLAGDGYRLSFADYSIKTDTSKEIQYIIPKKLLYEMTKYIKKNTGEITISLSDTHISLSIVGTTITGKIIQDKYPEYTSNIPEPSSTKIIFKADDLLIPIKALDKLKLANAVLHIETSTITITSKDTIKTIPCTNNDTITSKICFDIKHLYDFLMVFKGKEITMCILNSSSPVIIEINNTTLLENPIIYTYIISPVKMEVV